MEVHKLPLDVRQQKPQIDFFHKVTASARKLPFHTSLTIFCGGKIDRQKRESGYKFGFLCGGEICNSGDNV